MSFFVEEYQLKSNSAIDGIQFFKKNITSIEQYKKEMFLFFKPKMFCLFFQKYVCLETKKVNSFDDIIKNNFMAYINFEEEKSFINMKNIILNNYKFINSNTVNNIYNENILAKCCISSKSFNTINSMHYLVIMHHDFSTLFFLEKLETI